jgi:hypothetical protein
MTYVEKSKRGFGLDAKAGIEEKRGGTAFRLGLPLKNIQTWKVEVSLPNKRHQQLHF